MPAPRRAFSATRLVASAPLTKPTNPRPETRRLSFPSEHHERKSAVITAVTLEGILVVKLDDGLLLPGRLDIEHQFPVVSVIEGQDVETESVPDRLSGPKSGEERCGTWLAFKTGAAASFSTSPGR